MKSFSWKSCALVAALLAAGCAPNHHVGEASSGLFTNGGFESGMNGQPPASPWTITKFLDSGITLQTPQTYAGLSLKTSITGHAAPTANTVELITAGAPESQNDAFVGSLLKWPKYGSGCALVNQAGKNQNVNQLSQQMTLGASDVDSIDNQIHIRFVVAPVLEDPAHAEDEQPYFFIQVLNISKSNAVLYSNFNFSNQAGVPWQTLTTGGTTYDFTNWQLVDVAPGSAAALGDIVELDLVASGCSLGGHMGQLYVDGLGETVPGLFISGTGPAQVNPGGTITYTLNYENNGASAATSPTISFTMPPNTTYTSSTTPSVGGFTCAVTSGTLNCTTSAAATLAAGGAGSFTITVTTTSSPPAGTTEITAGNYSIAATSVSALLGPVINTILGCTLDSQCPSGDWCNETGDACTATLTNSTAMPIDATHTAPTLNGICTAAAATLVCASKVCDTVAGVSACGYANGDGSCNAGTATTVCRSGVCDTDGKCGYANNDGPCTPGTNVAACRSGVCDTNGICGYGNGDGPCGAGNGGSAVCRSNDCASDDLCVISGGCDLDADCSGGKWCDEMTHTCTPKQANNTIMPNDPGHNPMLDGTCSSSTGLAAVLVCVSDVCDMTDSKCGYADGDGSCIPGILGNGSVVCRSGVCSLNGKCETLGGCNVDADCAAGSWCKESTHVCTATTANGLPLPTDSAHTNPILDGSCANGVGSSGALVCTSGVCDPADKDCGYANSDGTCTPSTSSPVCRSGICDTDGVCGYGNGDGLCTPGAGGNGATVCRSTQCSSNGLCVIGGGCNVDADCATGNWCNETSHACTATVANGQALPSDGAHSNPTLDGTCTAAAGALVCTSGVCDPDGKCGFADGDGMCNTNNAATVCRSGACSMNGACETGGGCNVDTDCSTGNWCDEMIHQCTATLPNGMALPTDSPHTSPTLDGKCSIEAGALVCSSGVCDPTDDKCGYANGDGSCTSGNAATVCRSGACSMDGKCEVGGGCNVDTDCPTGNWCNETQHACTSQLKNGDPVPTDSAHSNPTLDGVCTAAVGALTCASGVCDTQDNQCGYAVGDGSCNNANGDLVCRSGQCSASGVCGPSSGCESNADCTDPNAPTCNPSSHTCTSSNNPANPSFAGGGFSCSVGGPASASDLALVVMALLAVALRSRRKRATVRL